MNKGVLKSNVKIHVSIMPKATCQYFRKSYKNEKKNPETRKEIFGSVRAKKNGQEIKQKDPFCNRKSRKCRLPCIKRGRTPGRHILENYTGNTRVFSVVVVYFLRKYTVYFPCNLRVPTEITRNTREIDTPQWRNDGEITLIC